jgi:hypothetical protein
MQVPSDVEIKDRYYGKEFIKLVQVEKNGEDFQVGGISDLQSLLVHFYDC